MIGACRNASLGMVKVRGPPSYGRSNECPPNRKAFTSVARNDRMANVVTEMISCNATRTGDERRGKRGRTDCQSTNVRVENARVATRKKKNAPTERQRY